MTGERGLQQAVFEYLRLALPDGAIAFAIPMGDRQITLAPGALAGVPDLCVIYRGRPIFIELKTAKGAVRPSQRFVHDKLTIAGAVVAVCRSLNDVHEFLTTLQVPLRARVAA